MRLPAILALSLSALLPCVAVAQTPAAKRPMTFADLMAMKRVSDPQISPSGKWVLFSVTDVSLEKNTKTNHLWLVPLAGGKEVQLTTGSGESNGRFSPDGKSVMYSVDGQIALAPWDDAAGSIGAGHGVTSLETGADGGLWAPDSKHFLFVSDVYPDCESTAVGAQRLEAEATCNQQKDTAATKSPVKAQIFTNLLYRHWDHYVGPKRTHIFYASVDGGVPEDLTPASVVGDHLAPTFSLGGPLGYAISPDGKEIAYEVNLDKVPAESTNNDIFTLQVGAPPNTAKKVSTSPGSDDGPQYSPDGKYLAWRSQARNGFESDQFRLTLMDRATGKSAPINMDLKNFAPDGRVQSTKPFDLWVDSFAWGDDSQHIFLIANDRGEEPIFETNITGDDFNRMGKAGGEWQEVNFRLLNGHVHVVGTKVSVDHPTEIYNYDLLKIDDSAFTSVVTTSHTQQTGEHTIVIGVARRVAAPPQAPQLTHLNDRLLAELSLTSQEPFWFAGANGTKVEGFLIKPPNFDPTKKYPVKFLIHGGPQGAWGDAWSYRWNPELFAANGYVVMMINPRGSTGYGQKFVDEVSGDWGGRPYTDLMKGLDYAEAKYPFIDKTRECALGASYGGFMANWVLTHTNRFKCIVTHDGLYDAESMFGSTEELWFAEWEFRPLAGSGPDAVVEQTKPAHPWDFYDKPANEDPFRKNSPMLYIKNAVTPTLVVHSQRDYRLDVSQGLELFTALQLRGVPSKMLYFPDEGHWVLKPQNSELWYKTVNDWCDRWTHTNHYAQPHP
jgi:dipeptidyl aminopeptidase/acylaminoacyl peptidase